MVLTLLFFICLILAARSLALLLLESKPVVKKLLDALFAIAFICLALPALGSPWEWTPATLAILAALLLFCGYFLIWRLITKKRFRLLTKTLFLLPFLLIYSLEISLIAFHRFTSEEELLRLKITGERRTETVEWKMVDGPPKKESLVAHEVIIDTQTFYLIGDEVGIKGKVVKFSPFLNLLGLRNGCLFESVQSAYFTPERAAQLPAQTKPLDQATTTFQKLLWRLWEELYFHKLEADYFARATAQAIFFPLVDQQGEPFQGSFSITMTAGGISAVQN